MTEDNKSKAINSEPKVDTTEGNEGGDNDSDLSEDSTIAEILSKELGREFKDDETALKSIKDTYGYVGKYGKLKPHVEKLQEKLGGEKNLLEFLETQSSSESAEGGKDLPQSDNPDFVPRDQYEKDKFFSEKPEYKPYEKLISALKSSEKLDSYGDVVELEEFKGMFEKASAQDDDSKSVIHSNSKLGKVTDKLSEAETSLKEGKTHDANKNAVGAVLDAYENNQ